MRYHPAGKAKKRDCKAAALLLRINLALQRFDQGRVLSGIPPCGGQRKPRRVSFGMEMGPVKKPSGYNLKIQPRVQSPLLSFRDCPQFGRLKFKWLSSLRSHGPGPARLISHHHCPNRRQRGRGKGELRFPLFLKQHSWASLGPHLPI